MADPAKPVAGARNPCPFSFGLSRLRWYNLRGMLREHSGGIIYYRFASLARCDGLIHGVFTRLGGVSFLPFAELNVSRCVGDDPQAVEANLALICEALGISPENLVTAKQVHGAEVAVVGPKTMGKAIPEADALVTDVPGVFLMLRFADCVPIALCDPLRRAVGLVHAGWRGTINELVRKAVSTMEEAYGCHPSDMVAGIGPSIGPCCYRVGEELGRLVKEKLTDWPLLLRREEDRSLYLDLWEANRRQLVEAGIERIEVAGICTACHSDEFFSHRAEGGRTGRFAVVIGMVRDDG